MRDRLAFGDHVQIHSGHGTAVVLGPIDSQFGSDYVYYNIAYDSTEEGHTHLERCQLALIGRMTREQLLTHSNCRVRRRALAYDDYDARDPELGT